MATPNLMSAASLVETLLCSVQLPDTSANTVYSVANNAGIKLATAAICNTAGSPVNVSVNVVPSGGTAQVSNRIISSYPLAAGDTISLTPYLAGMMLGAGDFISVTASTANAVNVILTGAVAT